ncbi:hypothetical protein PENTCL1PPCAC_4802 [Pristionchus entomophagus]|uniref:Uncharacterized protein n=1 Tax=Pristionchus entomophagus TaxID=358040 RepID=A0AAV5SIX6_9BILA|nr:hypothetical protein PENTCL1PPCAC_4802 [Pristionchus entomophagus]
MLSEALEGHFNEVVIPQWERAICRQALALDVRSESSMAALLHLLHVIWQSEYGAFPVAKRVAIGVMADMMQLNAPDHWAVEHFIKWKVLPHLAASGCTNGLAMLICRSMCKMLQATSGVTKTPFDSSSRGQKKERGEGTKEQMPHPAAGDQEKKEDEKKKKEEPKKEKKMEKEEDEGWQDLHYVVVPSNRRTCSCTIG